MPKPNITLTDLQKKDSALNILVDTKKLTEKQYDDLQDFIQKVGAVATVVGVFQGSQSPPAAGGHATQDREPTTPPPPPTSTDDGSS